MSEHYSQSMVPGPATSTLAGRLFKMQIPYPTPDIIDQKGEAQKSMV